MGSFDSHGIYIPAIGEVGWDDEMNASLGVLSAHTHAGGGSLDPVDYTKLASVPASFTPAVHASSHLSGGTDPVAGLGGLAITPDYELQVFDSTAVVLNGRTGATLVTDPSPDVCRTAIVNALAQLAQPGGTLKITSKRTTNGAIQFSTTLVTCPGLEENWTGRGKRGAQNGRDTGCPIQAATGFVGRPYLSWINPTMQQPPRAAPVVAAAGGGSGTPGTKYVAFTWVDYAGHESPLSPGAVVVLTTANRTVNVTLPAFPIWAASANLYMTPAAATWAPNTVYATSQVVMPTNKNGWAYKCTTAGNSHATTEPAWTVTGNTAIVDNTAQWTRIGLDFGRRASGTAQNMEFWQVATGVVTTTPTITTQDSAAGFTWAGIPYYTQDKVLYDQEGPPDVMAPAQQVVWAATTSKAVGNVVKPTGAGNGHLYRCISAAGGNPKTGGAEPVWPTGTNAVIADGDLNWMEAGASTGATTDGTHLMVGTFVVSGTEYLAYPVTSITAAGGLPVVVSCPAGPTGTTARKFYVAPVGSTTFKLAKTLSDNTTLLTSIGVADGALTTALVFGTNIPYLLPSPREDSMLARATMDCNGNAAGTQGADIAWLIRGAGQGNSAHGDHVKVMGYNQTGLRIGYCGEEVGSSDTRINELTAVHNLGSTGNPNAAVQFNCGDSSLTDFNAGGMAGQCIGVHVRAGAANVRIGGDNTHIGGSGGGTCNVWVDACNQFICETRPYLDNVVFPMGAYWIRPISATAVNTLILKGLINTNADVPWVTFDAGKGIGGTTGASSHGCSMVLVADMVAPGVTSSQLQPKLLFLNGYPNAFGLMVDDLLARGTQATRLCDSDLNQGPGGTPVTVTPDIEGSYMLASQSNTPVQMLSEQHIAQVALGNGVSTIVVPHNLRKAPALVFAMPTWLTTYRATLAGRTATQVTIDFGTATPDGSQKVDVFLKTQG